MADIVPATYDHAVYIADHVRPADADELWASCMMTPLEAMKFGMERGDKSYTGFHHGVPVCMWGVSLQSFIGMVGVPWMVATSHLDNGAAIPFLRLSKAMLLELSDGYDILQNYVDCRNTRAIRWLKYMGFSMQEPQEYGLLKLPFHKFVMEN